MAWTPASWAPEEGPEEGNLAAPRLRPRTADTRCAGRAAGRAASPSPRRPGSAAPAPCSSCWTGRVAEGSEGGGGGGHP